MTRFDANYYRRHTNHYLNMDLFQIPSFVWIKKALAVRPGERVLDAGCGTGYLLDFVCRQKGADQQPPGVGVDISAQAIKAAQKFFPQYRFIQTDLTKLPFRKGEFDKIFCFNVIEHIKNQKKALQELHRVLKRGGILLIGTNDKFSLSWRLFKIFCGGDPTHVKEFGPKEFIDFVGGEFKILKVAHSSCLGRLFGPVNQFLNLFLKGDILVKAKKA